MRLFSSNSGFRNLRDLILFVLGLSICIFHIVTTDPAHLSIPLLLFGGGMAGVTTVLRHDEKKKE